MRCIDTIKIQKSDPKQMGGIAMVEPSKDLAEKFQHYMIGVPLIDNAHLEILVLLDTGKHVSDPAEIRRMLSKLQELWRVHIVHEEAFMLEINFAFREHHVQSHNILTNRLDSIAASAETLIPLVTNQWYNPMSDFYYIIMDHLDHFDSQLIGAIKST